jgi:hypothetical protein
MAISQLEKSLLKKVFKDRDKISLAAANALIMQYDNADDFWDWFFEEYERNDVADFFLWSDILGKVHDYLLYLIPSESHDDIILCEIADRCRCKSVVHVDNIEFEYDINTDHKLKSAFKNFLDAYDESLSNKQLLKMYVAESEILITPLIDWMLLKINVNIYEDLNERE